MPPKPQVHIDATTGEMLGETRLKAKKSMSTIRPLDKPADVSVKVHLKDRDVYHPSNVVEGVVELEVKGAPSTTYYAMRLEFVGEEVVKRLVGDAKVGGQSVEGVSMDALSLAKPVIAKERIPIFHENILLAAPFQGEFPPKPEDKLFKLPDVIDSMSTPTQIQFRKEIEDKRDKYLEGKKLLGRTDTEKYLNDVVGAGEAGQLCPITGRHVGTLLRGKYYYPFAFKLPEKLPPSVSVLQDDASVKESKARLLAEAERKSKENAAAARLANQHADASEIRRKIQDVKSGNYVTDTSGVADLRAQRQQDKQLREIERMAAESKLNEQGASGTATSIMNPNKNDLVEIHYYIKAIFDGVPSHLSMAQIRAAEKTAEKKKEVEAMRIAEGKASRIDRKQIRNLIREKKAIRKLAILKAAKAQEAKEAKARMKKEKGNLLGDDDDDDDEEEEEEEEEDEDALPPVEIPPPGAAAASSSVGASAVAAALNPKKKKKKGKKDEPVEVDSSCCSTDSEAAEREAADKSSSDSDSDSEFVNDEEIADARAAVSCASHEIEILNKVIRTVKKRIERRFIEVKAAEMELVDFRYQRADSGISTDRRFFHVLSPLAPESQYEDTSVNKSRTTTKEFSLNGCVGTNGTFKATTHFPKTLFSVDRERISFELGLDNISGDAPIDKIHTSLVRRLTYRLDYDKMTKAKIAALSGKELPDEESITNNINAPAKDTGAAASSAPISDAKKKNKKAVRYEVVIYETDEVAPMKRKLALPAGRQSHIRLEIDVPLQSIVPSFTSGLVKCSYVVVLDITASGEKHRMVQPVVITHGVDASNTVPPLPLPPTIPDFTSPKSVAAPLLPNHHEAHIDPFPYAPQSHSLDMWKKRRNGSDIFKNRVNPNVLQTYRIPTYPVYEPQLIRFSQPVYTEWQMPVYNMDHGEADLVEVFVQKPRKKKAGGSTKPKLKTVMVLQSAFAMKYPAPFFQSQPMMRINGYFNITLPRWTQCPLKFDNPSVETLHRGDAYRERLDEDHAEAKRISGEVPTSVKAFELTMKDRKEMKAEFYKARKEKLLKEKAPKTAKYNPVGAMANFKIPPHVYGTAVTFPEFIKKVYPPLSSSSATVKKK